MKIGLPVVTLASASALALGVGAAQARIEVGAAQTQAAKSAAMQYRAATHYFNELRGHQTVHRSLRPDDRSGLRGVGPSNMGGQDQLSTPGWPGELPF
jgi:hypothetical protein